MLLEIELQLLTVVRALAEIAGLFLLAQGALFLLAGGTRDRNVIYQLFRIVTRPVTSLTRLMMPKLVPDKYISYIGFFLLFGLWILLAYVRLIICKSHGLTCN